MPIPGSRRSATRRSGRPRPTSTTWWSKRPSCPPQPSKRKRCWHHRPPSGGNAPAATPIPTPVSGRQSGGVPAGILGWAGRRLRKGLGLISHRRRRRRRPDHSANERCGQSERKRTGMPARTWRSRQRRRQGENVLKHRHWAATARSGARRRLRRTPHHSHAGQDKGLTRRLRRLDSGHSGRPHTRTPRRNLTSGTWATRS